MPGGGGYGAPRERDPALVARDVRFGLIDPEEAAATYGVELTSRGEPDPDATAARRTADMAAGDRPRDDDIAQ